MHLRVANSAKLAKQNGWGGGIYFDSLSLRSSSLSINFSSLLLVDSELRELPMTLLNSGWGGGIRTPA